MTRTYFKRKVTIVHAFYYLLLNLNDKHCILIEMNKTMKRRTKYYYLKHYLVRLGREIHENKQL